MSHTLEKDVSDFHEFVEALMIGQPEALTHATREAYAAGADVHDLFSVLEAVQGSNGISRLVIAQAHAAVCSYQWIADRRRALA